MKVLVTGVGGQLGHDVMNELARRGHQGVGSDIAPVYSGIADGSAVTGMPYVAMDITNEQQVRQALHVPDGHASALADRAGAGDAGQAFLPGTDADGAVFPDDAGGVRGADAY